MDPRPFTFRNLVRMATGRERAAWDKYSALICKIHNANCTDAKDIITPDQVNPYAPPKPRPKADFGEQVRAMAKALDQQQGKA